MTLKQLKQAIANKTPLVWNDPNPIEDNDYTISWIEDITLDMDEYTPILIQYNNRVSEAQVFLHEILLK